DRSRSLADARDRVLAGERGRLWLRRDLDRDRDRALGTGQRARQYRRQIPAPDRRARAAPGGRRRCTQLGAAGAPPEPQRPRDQLRKRPDGVRRPGDHDLEAGSLMLAHVRGAVAVAWLASILLVALGIAWFAMSAKPGS